MIITLGNIVFGGKGNGGSSTASAYVVPDGMRFAKSLLTEFPSEGLDFSQKTNFDYCWYDCMSLTSFPLIDTISGTSFTNAWYNCASLTSFPQLDLSNGSSFSMTWTFCSSLKEFPLINTAKGTNFNFAWGYCTSLTNFPMLDLSSGTDFSNAWSSCPALTTIGQLDLSSGTDFTNAWSSCSSLTNLGGFGAISADIDLSPCTNLTVESLMNVITQAATVTGKTMTLGSTNLAKLTDEQKAIATNKGWTLA